MSYVNYETLTLPDGTALTPGSTGNAVNPDFMDSYTTAPDGTVTFHASTKTARLYTAAGGGAAQPRKTINAGQVVTEITVYPGAHPGSTTRLIEARNSADTAVAARLNLFYGGVGHADNGKIEYLNASNVRQWLSTNAVPTTGTTPWRALLSMKKGTTTSNGEVHAALFTANGATTTDRFDSTAQNVGTSDVAALRWGFTSGGPADLRVRNIQWGTQADMAEFGPLSTATTIVRTSRIVREEDFSSSTGSNTTVSATQLSGPSVGPITVTGKVAEWVDTTTRTLSVVIRYTVGTATTDVTYPPLLRPSTQRLVSTGVGTGGWK